MKALDVYFHPSITAGPSDPYNRRNTAAAASYGQHGEIALFSKNILGYFWPFFPVLETPNVRPHPAYAKMDDP